MWLNDFILLFFWLCFAIEMQIESQKNKNKIWSITPKKERKIFSIKTKIKKKTKRNDRIEHIIIIYYVRRVLTIFRCFSLLYSLCAVTKRNMIYYSMKSKIFVVIVVICGFILVFGLSLFQFFTFFSPIPGT